MSDKEENKSPEHLSVCGICNERFNQIKGVTYGWVFILGDKIVCESCKRKDEQKSTEPQLKLKISSSHHHTLTEVLANYMATYGFHANRYMGVDFSSVKHCDNKFYEFRFRDRYNRNDLLPFNYYAGQAYRIYKNLLMNFKKDEKKVKKAVEENPVWHDPVGREGPFDDELRDALWEIPLVGSLTQGDLDYCLALIEEQSKIYEYLIGLQKHGKKRRKFWFAPPTWHKDPDYHRGEPHTFMPLNDDDSGVHFNNMLVVAGKYDYLQITKAEYENGGHYWVLPINNDFNGGNSPYVRSSDLFVNKLYNLKSLKEYIETQ